MEADYLDRFGGIGRLFGAAGLERLSRAHVCVVGVGGVGSWTVEALARTGIGAVTMVDMDDVCVTNTNRQLPALDGTAGRPKVDVLAERMRLINPDCRITAAPEFLGAGNAERLLGAGYDYVIDAVDRVSVKALIVAECARLSTPVLTVGGAGGRRDGSAVRVADLAFSQGDDLLRGVRRKLRRDHGFPSGKRSPSACRACIPPSRRCIRGRTGRAARALSPRPACVWTARRDSERRCLSRGCSGSSPPERCRAGCARRWRSPRPGPEFRPGKGRSGERQLSLVGQDIRNYFAA